MNPTQGTDRRPPVTDQSRRALYDRLVAAGVPRELAGDVYADLGDITFGLEKIQALFSQVAEGRNVMDALDEVESESRDHLRGHLKSFRKTTKRLRRLTRNAKRRPPSKRGIWPPSGDITGH